MKRSTSMKVAVIGGGMIGSAAARHLSKMGHDVVLVGPDEPTDYVNHDGVFGSHYDEGRITRCFDSEPFWRQANSASISRYAELKAESGVDFYSEVGVLHMGPADSDSVAAVGQITTDAGIRCEVYEGSALESRFPFLNLTIGMKGYFEFENAGFISPRRLVKAQKIAAERTGAQLIDEPALSISESGTGVTIGTRSGNIDADRVLVATGGHTQSLLGKSLGHTVFGRTVAMFRLEESEIKRLSQMPSMRYFGPKGEDPYILPPVLYPDGNMWLKLGTDPVDIPLESAADISDWFRSGGSMEVADGLQQQLHLRLRDFRFAERRVVPCMTTFGSTWLPCIGPISDRVTVAFGCYGKSAKCSDELGRLGGRALLGDVNADLAP